MIRKMLVLAATVAMPAAAFAGATAVTGAGVASAKALPPIPVTCNLAGSVTFAKPGLSFNGTLTNKTVEQTKTAIGAATGNPAACPTKTIKNKINTTPGVCATDPSPAPACALASAKTLAKDPNFYGTASSLATAGVSNIVASLAGGIATTNNGTKVTLQVTAPGTSSILPGGACGSDIGFHLSGAVTGGGAGVSSYVLNICLTGDSGTGTTGGFFADYLAAAGGNTGVTIAAATLGTASQLTFS